MKNLFTPEDFDLHGLPSIKELAAIQANEKLTKLIESWPVVVGPSKNYGFDTWSEGWRQDLAHRPSHRARLAFIEELPKELCKHEPTVDFYGTHLTSKPKCKHCGVELVAEWKVKE